MEIWKAVTGFPNYEVSNLGAVRNIVKNRFLKPTPVEKGGYLTVTIGGKRRKLNRLVAIEFIENPLNLPQVHHIDKNVWNNAATNLAWISNADNNKTENKNVRKKKRVFSKRHVFFIHKKSEEMTAKELAKKYKCNIDTISKIWRGVGTKNKMWKEQFYATYQSERGLSNGGL
jgi:hypothetical protein